MEELASAVGLVLVIEGLLYALAPGAAKRMAEAVRDIPVDSLRTGGLMAVALGVGIVYLARG